MKARCLIPRKRRPLQIFRPRQDHVDEMSAESVSSTGPTGAPRHLAVVHAGFELHEGVELEAKRDFITEKNWGPTVSGKNKEVISNNLQNLADFTNNLHSLRLFRTPWLPEILAKASLASPPQNHPLPLRFLCKGMVLGWGSAFGSLDLSL